MDEKEAEIEGGLVDLDGEDTPEMAVYEIGYHLLPTVSEDELPSAVSLITEMLKAENAVFVGERFPSKIDLAYSISKRIDGKRTNFESAYFGWIAFEITKNALPKIKAMLDAAPSVLRYLLITTDRNAVQVAISGSALTRESVTPTGDIGKPKRTIEEGGEVSEAALEQALQTIATEDAAVTEKI